MKKRITALTIIAIFLCGFSLINNGIAYAKSSDQVSLKAQAKEGSVEGTKVDQDKKIQNFISSMKNNNNSQKQDNTTIQAITMDELNSNIDSKSSLNSEPVLKAGSVEGTKEAEDKKINDFLSSPKEQNRKATTEQSIIMEKLIPQKDSKSALSNGDIYEVESNDTINLAANIMPNYVVHGSTGSGGDKFDLDYFKLTVTRTATLLVGGTLSQSYYNPYLGIVLSDAYNNNIAYSSLYNSSSGTMQTLSYTVTPGTYYLCVFNCDINNYTGTAMNGMSYAFIADLYGQDATLSDLEVNHVPITGFSSTKYNYSVGLPSDPLNYSITRATTDTNATSVVQFPQSLPGVVYVIVTAEDGIHQQTYTINFVSAYLSDIKVNGKSISGFSPQIYNYNVTLPSNTTSIQITPVKADPDETYTIINPASLNGIGKIIVNSKDYVDQRTYIINFTVAVPPVVTASPKGGTYTSAQSVALTSSKGGTIYYTLDGNDPTTSSSVYSSQISISKNTTLKFMAIDYDGNCSQICSEQYIINVLPVVTASPKGGTYTSAQSVSLTSSKDGTIYYTIDGSDPTTGSSVYSSPITINKNTTLKFMAVDKDGNHSTIGVEQYTINIISIGAPTANITPGNIASPTALVLSSTTAGVVIYYTLDGSTPTNTSTLYTNPIIINKDLTVKAVAIKDGISSTVSVFVYKFVGVTGIVAIVTKDSNGVFYEYNYTDLRNAYIDYQMGKDSPLFQHYVNKTAVAFKDGIKGYVDYNNIRNAYINAQTQGVQFIIETYLQSSQVVQYSMPNIIKRAYLKDGAVVTEDYVVH